MDTFKAFLNERLKDQGQIQLMQRVLQARDIEVKFIPKAGQDSYLKIRAKSVDPDQVFLMYVRDIDLLNIGSSMNVDF